MAKAYSQVFVSSFKHDSRDVYRARRRGLMENLDSACVFSGMPVDPGCEEAFTSTWTKFIQEPAFLFLTGVNQAGCFLLLDHASKSEILFVPKKDPFKEFWVGKRIGYLEGDSEAARLTGIKDVRPADKFYETLESFASKKGSKPFIYAFFHDKFQGDHNWKFKQKLERCHLALGTEAPAGCPAYR